jgi:hypothetical protein
VFGVGEGGGAPSVLQGDAHKFGSAAQNDGMLTALPVAPVAYMQAVLMT